MNKIASSAFLTVVFAFYALSKGALTPDTVIIMPEPPILSSSQGISSSETSSYSPYLASPSSSSSNAKPVPTPPVTIKPKPPVLTPITSSIAPVSSQITSSTPPRPPRSSKSSTPTPPPVSSSSVAQGMYKDGTYTGPSIDAYYGYVQVQVSIKNGQITGIQFLDYPQDRGQSVQINNYAMPRLKSEVISKQTAPVNAVSGATYTSQAFNQSIASALSQAKA